MCGIAGIVGPGATRRVLLELLEPIRRRGEPSGRAECWSSERVAIGTHRLKIVAPERGRQPHVSPDDDVACVVNGEIYNYRDLAAVCGLPPVCSDSEVLLAGYLEYGPSWFEALAGMFAFALIDRRGGETRWWLGRDPLGIKPLYVARRDDDVLFASELKSFHRFDTIEEIHQVAPGTIVSHAGACTVWRVPGFATLACAPDEAAQIVGRALARSVRRHLPAGDARVACLLSGGVDSSLVCALAARTHAGPVEAWTFASPEGGSSDLEAAALVCRALDIPLHTVRPTRAVLSEAYLAFGTWMVETWEPALVRNSVSYHLLCRGVAEASHKLCLSGEGADEVFGGYAYLDGIEASHRDAAIRSSLIEVHRTYLQMADRASMAATLEVRVPYMDATFVRRCVALPSHARHLDGENKVALRRALPRALPREILVRPKTGMNAGAGFGSNDPGQGPFHEAIVARYHGDDALRRRDLADACEFADRFGVDLQDPEQLWNFARFVRAGFHRLHGSDRRPQLNTTGLNR